MSGHSGRYIRGGDEPTKRAIYKPPGFQHFGDHVVNIARANAYLASRGIRPREQTPQSKHSAARVVMLLAMIAGIFLLFVLLASLK